MELVTVRDLFKHTADYAGKTVSVGGWVRSVRASKTFGFIVLSDGTFFQPLQVVYHDTMDNFAAISKTNVGAALIVRGTLVETPDARQPFELQAEEVTVEGASTPDYPLQKKRHTLEYLRTMTHLRPRTNTFSAAFRVRSVAAYGIHKFLQENGFAEDSIDGQLWFFKTEIESSERTAWNAIKDLPNTSDGAYEAGRLWCLKFERPRDGVGDSVERGNLAQNTYWPAYGGR